MAESKYEGHTPGPWGLPHFAREDSSCDCGYVFAGDERMATVAEVYKHGKEEMDGVTAAEAKANAQLIADAPKLAREVEELHAENRRLRDALKQIEDMYHGIGYDVPDNEHDPHPGQISHAALAATEPEAELAKIQEEDR